LLSNWASRSKQKSAIFCYLEQTRSKQNIGVWGLIMAWLQKIFTTVYEDSNGKRVSKNYKGAIKKRIKSKKWYAIWRDGKRRFSVPLAIDKQASLAMLAKLIRDKEYEAAGLINPYAKYLDKPILEHLEDYLYALQEEGVTEFYIQEKKRILNNIFKDLSIKTFKDITVDKMDYYLRNLKRKLKTKSHIPLAPNTKLMVRNSLIGFANWLKRKGRIENNHLLNITVPRGKPLRVRRALSVAEVQKLLIAAKERPKKEGMINNGGKMPDGMPKSKVRIWSAILKPETIKHLVDLGEERALIYKTAVFTGLRKGELKALKVGYLDFTSKPFPSIRLSGEFTKNGKAALISLVPSLADEINDFIIKHKKNKNEHIFNVPDKIHTIFKRDLESAGIPYRSDDGRYADFHSLRTSANTMLGCMEIPIKIRQLFMRHSDIRLTVGTYDDASLYALSPIVEAFEKVDHLLKSNIEQKIDAVVKSENSGWYDI
jgi:integrase